MFQRAVEKLVERNIIHIEHCNFFNAFNKFLTGQSINTVAIDVIFNMDGVQFTHYIGKTR